MPSFGHQLRTQNPKVLKEKIMDMEKQVAKKIALTALTKVQESDQWEEIQSSIQSEVDWKKLEQLIPEDNFDELFEEHLKDSESFIRVLDKLNEEVEAEIKRLESSLVI